MHDGVMCMYDCARTPQIFLRSVILDNKIMKMLDLLHFQNLYALKICMYEV